MERWLGKVAIITGASSGIGAAIAEKFVQNGIIVAGIARRLERIEEHSRKLVQFKGELHAIKTDVAQEDQLINTIKYINSNLGPVQILVNNAGIGGAGLLTGSSEKWNSILKINVLALCTATKEVVTTMQEHQINGHIFNMNSLLGHGMPVVPGANRVHSLYAASKYAITALTEATRQELNVAKSRIKVTSISPGLVDTELSTQNPNLTKETREFYKGRPILQPEDVADAVVFCLNTPEHVQVHEMIIKPVGELF